jgi:hypothetical protein
MLDEPGYKGTPLKEAVFETLCFKENAVKQSIPKFIKKSLGIIRREANQRRKENGEEELNVIV